jgi:hypothetical protein
MYIMLTNAFRGGVALVVCACMPALELAEDIVQTE